MTATIPLDSISHYYVTLAFSIDRLVPGFIDAYNGPPEVRVAATAGDAPEPARLVEAIKSLLLHLAEADVPASRIGYLTAQLGAMLTICRGLAGEEIPYPDEVHQLFDVEPTRTPDADFAQAIATLDQVLPGGGAVRDRMAAWRRQFEVSPAVVEQLIAAIQPEIRQRTAAIVTLPAGEAIDYQFVQNEPWSGYNWYLGDAKSRVELNTDLPIEANRLVNLLCHEGYPGHHTEHALKERLYLDQGFGEHAIQLINTPECIISEGIATLAEEVLFGGEGAIAFRHDVVYPLAGIAVDREQEQAIARATARLRGVAGNAALMLHADGVAEARVQEYLEEFALLTTVQAAKRLEFIRNPLWRAYIFTYHAGYDLLRAWLDAPPPTEEQAKFRVLLTEQVYPSLIYQLLAESAH